MTMTSALVPLPVEMRMTIMLTLLPDSSLSLINKDFDATSYFYVYYVHGTYVTVDQEPDSIGMA